MDCELQAAVLAGHGATPPEIEELLRYNESRFSVAGGAEARIVLPAVPSGHGGAAGPPVPAGLAIPAGPAVPEGPAVAGGPAVSAVPAGPARETGTAVPAGRVVQISLPLQDEPFVQAWEGYAAEARQAGAGAVLRRVLPQLRFPIRAGISGSPDYRAATRRGEPPDGLAAASGLPLERPELLAIVLHASPAGRIPLLIARHRQDFVLLVQALTGRNEPVPVTASQGAAMVAGYVNWQRVAELRRVWEAEEPAARGGAAAGGWAAELARLAERRELYQDRFILLGDGPYSGVPAAAMGLDEEEWLRQSLIIRREHECAHYLTRRLFGSMRNNALDELIADFAGITAAAGGFRADWFLRFIGLESFPRYRAGARLDLYRGKPPLSAGAFAVLRALLHAAARGLERWDAGLRRAPGPPRPFAVAIRLAAIAALRLEDLASAEAGALLDAAHTRASAMFGNGSLPAAVRPRDRSA